MADSKSAKPRSISKTDLVKALVEETQVEKKSVVAVLDAITKVIEKNLSKKGPGVIALPGLVKIQVVQKKATPAKKGVMVLGQLRDIPAKPARKQVKVRALKALRDMI